MAVVRDVGKESKYRPSEEKYCYTFHDGSQRDSTLQMLQSFRRDKVLCDVELLAGTTKILAHRCVLAAFSPYFRAMFCAGMSETFVHQIEMKGINPVSLQQIVDFAYTAEIKIDINNVQELMIAADLLEIYSIKSACSDFLCGQLHPSNCLGIRQFAKHLACAELYNKAHEFTIWCFPYLGNEEEFLEMDYSEFVDLLCSEEMCVHTQDDVLKLILEWMKYDITVRHLQLPHLLATIDIHHISETSQCQLRHMITATEDSQGRIEDYDTSKHAFIPEDGEWKEIIMVFGGERCGDSLKSCEVYNADVDSWEALVSRPSLSVPQLNQPRSAMSTVQTLRGIYVFGGVNCWELLDSIEFFNSHKNTWSVLPTQLPHARHGMDATVHDYQIFVSGGCDGALYLNKVDVLDLRSDSWYAKPGMLNHRGQHSAVSLGRFIYFLGGAGGASAESNDFLRSVERYDPVTDESRMVSQMLDTRASFAAATLGDLIYVAGGNNTDTLRSSECYDPNTDQWTRLPTLISPRRGFSLVPYRGDLYAFGGFDGQNDTNTVEKYDPWTNKWVSVAPMTTSRYRLSAGVVRYPMDKLQHQTRKISV